MIIELTVTLWRMWGIRAITYSAAVDRVRMRHDNEGRLDVL
jgi:hypothetical protein